MDSPSPQQTLLVMGRLVAMVSNMQSPLWSCRYDEVLVGAPYYSPEAGRVYVYRNNAVSSNDNSCTLYCVLKRKTKQKNILRKKTNWLYCYCSHRFAISKNNPFECMVLQNACWPLNVHRECTLPLHQNALF